MALEIQNHIIMNYLEEPGVTEIRIPEGIREIGDNAFQRCSTLEKVILPATLYRIGQFAFTKCENLSCIEIQRTIHNVSHTAVTGCPNLNSIIYYGTEIPLKSVRTRERDHAFHMIAEKSFFYVLNSNQYLIWHMFSATPEDMRIMIYIGKHFPEMFRILLDMKEPEILKKFLKTGKFLLEKNIDDFIQYANQVQNYEAQILLTEYKFRNYSIPNIAERLKL